MTEINPLNISSLGHAYGKTPVLNQLDLCVGTGEFVALLGSSGCGKTTLLKAIAGLVTPHRGSIEIDGSSVVNDGIEQIPCELRGVGLVFQEYALFPHMTVAENVGYGIARGSSARVNGLLELLGLKALGSRLPAELSGGQQQRVALARALAPRPALLLLDEPFANVDAALRQSLSVLLRRVVRDEGASVLMVTHDQRTALALADRVVVLETLASGGEIRQDASPATVYQRPVSEQIARLTGPCVCVDGIAAGDQVSTGLGDLSLIEPRHGPVRVMLRPEQLSFTPSPSGDVTIDDVVFSGPVHKLLCSTSIGQVEATIPGQQAPPEKSERGSIVVLGPVWAV